MGDNFFQILKPCCVSLNENALRYATGQVNQKDVIKSLTALLRVLKQKTAEGAQLDVKLADYVFFPLSHILRQTERLPFRALELCLSCISVLLRTGWRRDIPVKLGGQLLLLLPRFASNKPLGAKQDVSSDDVRQNAFLCLSDLFSCLSESENGRQLLLDMETPTLGFIISIILDSWEAETANNVLLSSGAALSTIVHCYLDAQRLSTFLPGLISALTRTLIPRSTQKYSTAFTLRCLTIFTYLLSHLFSSGAKEPEPSPADPAQSAVSSSTTNPYIADAVPHIKQSVEQILVLRDHDDWKVRRAVLHLCTTILRQCQPALSDLTQVLVQNAVAVLARSQDRNLRFDFIALLKLNPSVADSLRTSLHTWIISLPRIFESRDDNVRSRLCDQIACTYQLLSHEHLEISLVDTTLTYNMVDAVYSVVNKSSQIVVPVVQNSIGLRNSLKFPVSGSSLCQLPQLLFQGANERMTAVSIKYLASVVYNTPRSDRVIMKLLVMAKGATGLRQLSTMWILQLLVRLAEDDVGDESIADKSRDAESPGMRVHLLNDLYYFALSLITDESPEQIDWRTQALALEAIALRIQLAGRDLSGELVDILYPMLHLLYSPIDHLSAHALACLSVVAKALGYENVLALIVGNADYLVNSILWRLDSFNATPETLHMLSVLVNICGKTIYPFLGDVTESIIMGIDRFHGYPRLTELLFAVLAEVTHQCVDDLKHSIEEKEARRSQLTATAIEDVGTVLKLRQRIRSEEDERVVTEELGDGGTEANKSREEVGAESDKKADPMKDIRSLLLRVATLTQHHLPSSSIKLQGILLQLLPSAFRTLRGRDELYPLINTLWPVVVNRIEDRRAETAMYAIEVMTEMCSSAGDFMSRRVESVWPAIQKFVVSLQRKTTKTLTSLELSYQEPRQANDMVTHQEQMYVMQPDQRLSESLVKLAANVLQHVSVSADTVDEIVETAMLLDANDSTFLQALEGRSPDVAWLLRLSQSR